MNSFAPLSFSVLPLLHMRKKLASRRTIDKIADTFEGICYLAEMRLLSWKRETIKLGGCLVSLDATMIE